MCACVRACDKWNLLVRAPVESALRARLQRRTCMHSLCGFYLFITVARRAVCRCDCCQGSGYFASSVAT